ncbi:hypothetical protein M0657_003504 [Pyricularia oryzae]|uniref:Uncharacterized protein n=3 Tax=Pyricularia oryzae TaxID=318829 RepID=A0A4P7N8Q3_PYROR|nr:hypothetical protein OOU_Y34scaffold00162g77 [Pyricularia oryzae Y34]KAI7919854.1 hypothetical protein M9X92_006156 [Pyricularia oryzae]KAI7926927.1 hypothetical protein M0657_003504 [Pyricularia oryzae]QBZ56504.1 hypothetical protein PoMZ_01413 [Pyricularia oryzae]
MTGKPRRIKVAEKGSTKSPHGGTYPEAYAFLRAAEECMPAAADIDRSYAMS